MKNYFNGGVILERVCLVLDLDFLERRINIPPWKQCADKESGVWDNILGSPVNGCHERVPVRLKQNLFSNHRCKCVFFLL